MMPFGLAEIMTTFSSMRKTSQFGDRNDWKERSNNEPITPILTTILVAPGILRRTHVQNPLKNGQIYTI